MTVEDILEGIIQREGGYVSHPLDKGSHTKYGITIRTLEAWRQAPQTAEDVMALTKAEAKDIYQERYV